MSESRMKPLFLVKPGTMSRADIRRAEKLAGVCIVECADPEGSRYSDPPIDAEIDVQARAALSLLRVILRQESPTFHRGDLTKPHGSSSVGRFPNSPRASLTSGASMTEPIAALRSTREEKANQLSRIRTAGGAFDLKYPRVNLRGERSYV